MYGVLKTSTNTGLDTELSYVFAAPLSVISNRPAFAQDTMNLRRRTSSQGVQRWEIEANISPLSPAENYLIHSSINGYTDRVYIRMPQIYRKQPVDNTFTLTLSNNKAAGDSTMSVLKGGAPVSVLAPGDFFSFAGDSKVYLVSAAGINGTGVDFFPPLLSSKVGGTTIVYGDKVTMMAKYDTTSRFGIAYVDGILTDVGSVKYIEDL